MTLTELIDRYGYLAVVLGTFVEGETILVLAGFAVHQGYLGFPWVVLAAFAGSLSGDQLAYLIGRRHGAKVLRRFPKLQAGVTRATELLRAHQTMLLLGFRFVYGIRNVTPIAAGLAEVPVPRFVALNALGALLWSVSVAAAGYFLGRGFVTVLERARSFEEHAFAAILLVGVTFAVLRQVLKRRRSSKPAG